MSVENDGGPAFPVSLDQDEKGAPCVIAKGMSLRDWFAGMALQGFISSVCSKEILDGFNNACQNNDETSPEMHATIAYSIADAMISERSNNAK